MILATLNCILPFISLATKLVIVIIVVFDVVDGTQFIKIDVFINGEHEIDDCKIVVVFTALVGQYFGIEIVNVVLYGIINVGLIETIIDEIADVVDGFAVILHCRLPYIISMPDEPKLVT